MARRRVHLALCLALLSAAPRLARADAIQDLVSAAYEAAKAGRWDEVPEYVKRADKIAPNADTPVLAHTLARLWYLEGVSYWFGGLKEGALDPWRLTFQAEIDYQWESEAFVDEDGEALFESLRRETRSRTTIPLGVPKDTGATRIFIGGHPVDATSRMVEGRYLVQAVCSDGTVQGKWWKYGKPPKYDSFCPNGFGTRTSATATPASTGGGEVLFDDFGNPIVASSAVRPTTPAATTPAADEKKAQETAAADKRAQETAAADKRAQETAAAEKKAKETAAAEKKAKEAAAEKKAKEAAPKDTKKVAATPPKASSTAEGGGSKVASVLLMGGGGALLAGGAVANFLLVNPTWTDIQAARDKPATVTREEADDLTARFNTWRAVTLGLLGAGAAGVTVGVLVHDTRIFVVPGGFVAEGRF